MQAGSLAVMQDSAITSNMDLSHTRSTPIAVSSQRLAADGGILDEALEAWMGKAIPRCSTWWKALCRSRPVRPGVIEGEI